MSPAALDPEDHAREDIDALLGMAGWDVQDADQVNLAAAHGVAVRYLSLKPGHGEADYVLFVAGKALGVVEAKPRGTTLTGVEPQSKKYSEGFPDDFAAHRQPLPFLYESTGEETRFTNLLDPDPRSRDVFAFHGPETLEAWLANSDAGTLRARLERLPPLNTERLWSAQIKAIANLERSLADERPRALIQMSGGSGKTYTAVSSIYRLLEYGGARRVLFLVDRNNLARQTLNEFQQYRAPDDGRLFTDLYNVQRLTSNRLDPVARVCITTIQRLYSMLRGDKELDPEAEEASLFDTAEPLYEADVPVEYNPAIPIEFFDFIITDECHRSIYNLWAQVLEYFDAFLIGLTATPSMQTLGFFNQNLVMEYPHEQAVIDNVNVPFHVYSIRTRITQQGSKVEAGWWVEKRDRLSRARRRELMDQDFAYGASELDRSVVARDQIRTVVRTFKNRALAEMFPERKEVPKTIIFAKNDSHADDIVQIVREEFARGNEFAQKITYRTTGKKPEDLISEFRNSFNPRIAVTVDMIATGTDIRPVEIVFFMRTVKTRNYFEQMKYRGVRVISETDLRGVTPDASSKDRMVIVDAVGIHEEEMTDSRPLDQQPTVSFERVLHAVSLGNRAPETASTLAVRLSRLENRLSDEDRTKIEELAGGRTLRSIARDLLDATDPDVAEENARKLTGREEPPPEAVQSAAKELLEKAMAPIATNPALRNKLLEVQRASEQLIDHESKDEVIEAGFSEEARDRFRSIVQSFEQYLRDHKDEITAIQILYSRPRKRRLTLKEIQDLAKAIRTPPRNWTPDVLWRAYQSLDKSKVRGNAQRTLADLVSIVRFALRRDGQLVPFEEAVRERFARWLAEQEKGDRRFTDEQRQWLELIRDHVAASLTIETDDFELTPFSEKGGLGKAAQVFGADFERLLTELNEVLAA